MNLHSYIAPIIGAVNPLQQVTILISVGNMEAADGTQQPTYATPGGITASIGGTYTASISGTTLTVSAILSGDVHAGDAISGTDGMNSIPAGTTIVEQLSGPPGWVGTYQLSQEATLNPCTVTSANTILNVSAVVSGALQAGQTLADVTGHLLAGTLITGQLQGNAGGAGLYSLSQQQTVASETMTTALSILAQVQPLAGGDLRHMDALNLQGSHRAIYITGRLAGLVRVALKGGDLVILSDGSVWLVTQPSEPWHLSAGWTKAIITLQDEGAIPATGPQSQPTVITPNYFGQIIKSLAHAPSWPSPVTSADGRLWLQGTDWASVATSRGVYNWSNIDPLVARAQSAGMDIIYTFGQVPGWANGNAGASVPPTSFQDFYDYATALFARYPSIKFCETWNEVNLTSFWSGTYAQMATLAQNLYPIVKAAGVFVFSPSFSGLNSYSNLTTYLATGAGAYADGISVHPYGPTAPEGTISLLQNFQLSIINGGQQAKPLWVTEFGWGNNSGLPSPTDQASFAARSLLIILSCGPQRFYWYDDGGAYGILVTPSTNVLTIAGIAYNQVVKWLTGATIVGVANSGTTWQVVLSRSSGYSALAVWDTSGSNPSFKVPSQFIQYHDLSGNVTAVSGSVILTSSPILLETSRAF